MENKSKNGKPTTKVPEPKPIRSSHPPVHARPLWLTKATTESLRDLLTCLCQSNTMNGDCQGRMERILDQLTTILEEFKLGVTHLKELEASANSNAFWQDEVSGATRVQETTPSAARPFAKSKRKLKNIAVESATEVRGIIDRTYGGTK